MTAPTGLPPHFQNKLAQPQLSPKFGAHSEDPPEAALPTRSEDTFQSSATTKTSQEARHKQGIEALMMVAALAAHLKKESEQNQDPFELAKKTPLPAISDEEKIELGAKKPADIPLPAQSAEEIEDLSQKVDDKKPANASSQTPKRNETAETKTPAITAAAPVKPATEAAKTETTKTENKENEKKDDEGGGILQGWKKTKMGLGAALLAGGIALKMTLIGIVPGLIMAGAGAALMGWAGINWAMGGKKDGDKTDENKDKKADAPATENK